MCYILVAEKHSAAHIDLAAREYMPILVVLGNSSQDFDCYTEQDNPVEKVAEDNLEVPYTVEVQGQ